ncbi:MAG: hypothetical protein Q9200_000373 [Gallowayella weberi]
MQVIIVGAGISGLACYLFLRKHLPSALPSGVELHITIVESHAVTKRKQRSDGAVDEAAGQVANTIGAALGLAPNGLSVLRDLDETVFAKIANSGYPVSHFELKNARGYSLARIGATNHEDPELHTVLISRQRLWDCLRDHVPDDAILERKIVSEVSYTDDHSPVVNFADGSSSLKADIIIGADGAKSVIKRTVTGNGKVDAYPAVFDGMVGVGGFIPSSFLSENEPRGRMTVTFGAHGFFGYGASTVASQSNHFAECTAPMGEEATWWSTYETEDLPDTRNFDKEDIQRQLKERHAGWKDPVVRKIVDAAVTDSVYPTWIMPDLPTWHARGLVLIGDAAHAMQPSSGQGASQGLEDAQILSMLLAHYVERHFSQSVTKHLPSSRNAPATIADAVDRASMKYCELRKPRVKLIVDRAKQMGDTKRQKGLVKEWFTYSILWIIGEQQHDPKSRKRFFVNKKEYG